MKGRLTIVDMNLKKLIKMQALEKIKDSLFLLFLEISEIIQRNLN